MTKQKIIEMISNAVDKDDMKIFCETEENVIGSNQFRELAVLCRHAECFEEIKMLIQYNEAKAIVDSKDSSNKPKDSVKRNSWATIMKCGKSFADIVIDCMDKIKEDSGNDEAQCMKNLSLFFGYFYWYARIRASESKTSNSSEEKSNDDMSSEDKSQKTDNNSNNDGNNYKSGENKIQNGGNTVYNNNNNPHSDKQMKHNKKNKHGRK